MAIRRKRWKQAISYYEKQLKTNERDYALWNMLGDLHSRNKSTTQAIESWRHALEGYALEGLYESVLGVGRKMQRHAPTEEEINLQIADAYLGLEYYADCFSTFRSYVKLARHRSEPEMRALFKKIMESEIRFPHLLGEISALYKEARLEDIELEKAIESYVERMSEVTGKQDSGSGEVRVEDGTDAKPAVSPDQAEDTVSRDGLAMLGGGSQNPGWPEDVLFKPGFETSSGKANTPPSLDSNMEVSEDELQGELPEGEGKDHYDLGVVYTEMSLWDAAVAEFESARRDPSYRHQATLGLANCYQNTNDLQKALNLLEAERKASASGGETSGELHFQLGDVYELLGNMEEALECFERIRGHSGPRGSVDERIREIKMKLDSSSENTT